MLFLKNLTNNISNPFLVRGFLFYLVFIDNEKGH
jgi:hypothetical protein